jgi:hypothetical protein
MLTIRNQQFDALFEARLPEISRDLAAYVRRTCPDAVAALDDEALLQRVLVGARRARRWGFESMFGFAVFVTIMLEVAPDFDTHPRVRALLDVDSPLALDARLQGIAGILTEDEWEELAKSATPSAWENLH